MSREVQLLTHHLAVWPLHGVPEVSPRRHPAPPRHAADLLTLMHAAERLLRRRQGLRTTCAHL